MWLELVIVISSDNPVNDSPGTPSANTFYIFVRFGGFPCGLGFRVYGLVTYMYITV